MENITEDKINSLIKEDGIDSNLISDGYHTFGELYDFRIILTALLFNKWAEKGIYNVHKSKKHSDGEYCFNSNGEWFAIYAMLPDGLISFHYKIDNWNLFKMEETDKAMFEFDGHTSIDVLERLKDLI